MSCPSGTPLVKKLGIKEAQRVAFLDAPPDFRRTLGELPPGVFPEAELAFSRATQPLFVAPASRALHRRVLPAGSPRRNSLRFPTPATEVAGFPRDAATADAPGPTHWAGPCACSTAGGTTNYPPPPP